jgi:hypothetical protein
MMTPSMFRWGHFRIRKTPYYPCMLDLYPEPKSRPFLWGMAVLLRELVIWVPEPKGDKGLVLGRPDFDIQNVIVSEEGELRGRESKTFGVTRERRRRSIFLWISRARRMLVGLVRLVLMSSRSMGVQILRGMWRLRRLGIQ